jgi:O-antigen/teichoic acid export membrane protein
MAGAAKRVAGGAAWALVGQVVALGCGLWATRFLIHGLGPDTYAVLVLLIGVQGGVLGMLGNSINTAILVLLAGEDVGLMRRRSRALALWSLSAASVAVAVALALGSAGVGGLFWKDPASLALWRAILPWAALAWAGQLLCAGLWAAQRARLRMAQAEMQQALGQALVTLSGPVGLMAGASLPSVVMAQALCWSVLLLGSWSWERALPESLDLRPRLDRDVLAEAWHIVAWTLLTLAGSAVFTYGDRFFSLQAGPRELSAYGIATSLTIRIPSAMGMMGPLALPILAAARRDLARAAQLQRLFLAINLLVATAACLPLAAGGAALIGAWVGPDVQALAEHWMLLLSLACFFFCLAQAMNTALVGLGMVPQTALIALLGAGVGVACGFYASQHGQPGSAWMALSGQATAAILGACLLERRVLGRGGLGWVLTLLPFLLAAGLGAWLLRGLGFPEWLGPGLLGHLACFALAGAAVMGLGLAAETVPARRAGRESLWGHARALARRSPDRS